MGGDRLLDSRLTIALLVKLEDVPLTEDVTESLRGNSEWILGFCVG
jgi:hypothetical protein